MKYLISSVFRARSAGLLRLRKVTHPVRLICKSGICGLCCRVTGGDVIVHQNDLSLLPANSTLSLGTVTVLKSTNGRCDQLDDKSCGCYPARPRGCREYPWYNINGVLYYDIGCPGIRHDTDERPYVNNITPIEQYLPTTNLLREILIALFRLW
jgi:Fe-S-cluster containining protein